MTKNQRAEVRRLLGAIIWPLAKVHGGPLSWEQLDDLFFLRRYYDKNGVHHQKGRAAQRLAKLAGRGG